MSEFATINGVNKSLGDGWATINGVYRKLKCGWETKDGVWQQILSSGLPELNDCTWAQISEASSSGQAPNYWAIGDRKAVTVSGTVGTLSISGTYYVYILGFNHNGATNTIDFGTFKTALSGGTDICLIDGSYNTYKTDGTKLFNMNHWGNYNYGGWKGCDLRYDILGSTNVAPSGYGSAVTTSRVGHDASDTCATSPVSGTLMAALPSELRDVMKPMTIYTDSVGNSSNVAANVTTSIDYLPLLAEFEIFGVRKGANQYEQNYQAQYSYFAAGNSTLKLQHSSTGSTAYWLERSPRCTSGGNFCAVDVGASLISARHSYGIAPIFRV